MGNTKADSKRVVVGTQSEKKSKWWEHHKYRKLHIKHPKLTREEPTEKQNATMRESTTRKSTLRKIATIALSNAIEGHARFGKLFHQAHATHDDIVEES